MKRSRYAPIREAKNAALQVLLHNNHGPFFALPRTAGWGYPEPYTRDLMISALGILASGNEKLTRSLRRVLLTLGRNQNRLGQIPGLVHDPYDLGASDTTPLFLIGLALYRKVTGESGFLEEAAQKALTWMEYQSPDDLVMVAQQPTNDWRDEQWVLGFGLYVNTLVYLYLRLFGLDDKAHLLRRLMNRFEIHGERRHHHAHEGFVAPYKPYYALWTYKVLRSDRFDLLGNSLAIISGIASRSRADAIITWAEEKCHDLREKGELALDLPPCLFPYIRPEEPDWRPRYDRYNMPGQYHNGGVWPFICGFYVAALTAAGRFRLAERKLTALAELVRPAREAHVDFGFNEWFHAQDGTPRGQDWQTWSAAMFLYAATCVERKSTLFLDEVRDWPPREEEDERTSAAQAGAT